MLPLHHDEINVQLLTGVVQNQYLCPCRFPRNLLFIVYASGGRHFVKLL
nr:MAG TPA: hypothetical protein [Caudoviricetes sp.]